MCHDLDHRGTNNSFQVASVSGKHGLSSSLCASVELLGMKHQTGREEDKSKLHLSCQNRSSEAQNGARRCEPGTRVLSGCNQNSYLLICDPPQRDSKCHCDYRSTSLRCTLIRNKNGHRQTTTAAESNGVPLTASFIVIVFRRAVREEPGQNVNGRTAFCFSLTR